jgi:enediyne biosynthesis protein E5
LSATALAARRHYLNPSNFGITATLVLFHWVGIAPPYMFTENVRGPLDVILPLILVASGSLLNTLFTERIPLILVSVALNPHCATR